jgi:hypothetical protein
MAHLVDAAPEIPLGGAGTGADFLQLLSQVLCLGLFQLKHSLHLAELLQSLRPLFAHLVHLK